MSQMLSSPQASSARKAGNVLSLEPQKDNEDWFWGSGKATSQIQKEIDLAGRHGVHVVVVGETGTGKEVVARRLHARRREHHGLPDAEAPFVAINCGAIPEALAESILFGHERGAFTSARERQYGKFELAKKGSLFLDEIQTLPLLTQVKLLRVLQSGEIERLGSRNSTKIECHVVAATNVPLELLVEKQLFRRDLYYRLNICPIYLPPLRQRKEDLPFLIQGLLKKIHREHGLEAQDLSASAFEAFLKHNWPGNIRELEHCLLYAALRSAERIEKQSLPPSLTGELASYLGQGQWS